jgi:hypothetical protein
MVDVTSRAKSVLHEALELSGFGTETGLRLRRQEGKLTLDVDQAGTNDRSITHEGRTVLIIDQELDREMGEVRVDIGEDPNGPELVMRMPA